MPMPAPSAVWLSRATPANACTTSLAPCRSIQHAVDVSISGDPILVSTGVYTGVTGRAP